MVGYKLNLLILVLSLTSITAAATATGTSSLCNPLKTSSCPSEKALGTDISLDFKEESDYFTVKSTESGVSYDDDGLSLTLKKRLDNPSLMSTFYIMFGRVEVSLKAGNGKGIVSSFYLQSNDLDEIDIELIGGDTTQWQSNYFVKGNVETYDRGEFHNTGNPPQEDYHNYTIDWTNERIIWYYDNQAVRTLKNDSSQGFPQSPMYLMTGIWAGGDPSNPPGTIEWAGGLTDYSKAPFAMHINHLSISDYSSGKSYSYGDQSGKWTSIKAEDGKVLGRLKDADIDAAVDDDEEVSSSESSDTSSSSTNADTSSSTGTSSSTDPSSSMNAESSDTIDFSSSSTSTESKSSPHESITSSSSTTSKHSEEKETSTSDMSESSHSSSAKASTKSDSGTVSHTPSLFLISFFLSFII